MMLYVVWCSSLPRYLLTLMRRLDWRARLGIEQLTGKKGEMKQRSNSWHDNSLLFCSCSACREENN